MNIQKDFEEFLQLLNATGVEFVIVGGYAVAFHGYVRTIEMGKEFLAFISSPNTKGA